MRRVPLSAAMLVLSLAASAPAAPATQPTNTLPSIDDIKKEYEAKDYQAVLRDVGRGLTLGEKKAAEAGLERYDLFMLRGEAQLRLNQPSPAAMAFHEAARATKDLQQAAVAYATEMLVRRSKQMKFTPRKPLEKNKKLEPIDILDPDKRKEAFEALYNDERDAAASILQAGKKATSLPQIRNAVKAIQSRQLFALDRAAHGTAQDMEDTTRDLKERAQDLMSKALEKLAKQVDDIEARANETVRIPQVIQAPNAGVFQQDIVHRRGLQGSDRQNLKGIAQTSVQIAAWAKELIGALSDNADDSKDLLQQAEDVARKAEKASKEDYGN